MSNLPPMQIPARPQGSRPLPEQPFPSASLPALPPFPLNLRLVFIVRYERKGTKEEPFGVVKRQLYSKRGRKRRSV